MKQNTRKGLYTVLYPFMASVLNLAGLAKARRQLVEITVA